MRKTYIFLTPTICNIGGAQLYIRNKLLFLKKEGWNVNVISAEVGNVPIMELREYDMRCPEIIYKFFLYTKTDRNKTLDVLISMVDSKDCKIIIESNSIAISTWGEVLSKRINAKHIVYLIDENITVSNWGIWNFLDFKDDRGELASIYPISYNGGNKLKKKSIVKVPPKLLAQASQSVEADIDSPYIGKINKEQYDYVIGFFSRLLKPFVIPAFYDIKKYTEFYRNKQFFLLVIGDDNVPQTNYIYEMFRGQQNVNLIITGRLYPVPISLLDLCDVFVGSAGCAKVCQRSGVPTISYDAKDHRPIGVLGYTTANGVYREKGSGVPDFKDLLDEILIYKKYPRYASNYLKNLPEYKDHIEFIKKSGVDKDYYEINSILPESNLERSMHYILRVNGYRGLCKAISKYKKFRRIFHKLRG